MKPFFILIATFIVSLVITKIFGNEFQFLFAGRVAMALMLLFTAMGHFAFKKGMAMMIPKPIPYKTEIVFLTGIIEIIAAIGLLVSNLRSITAWLLIAFFILILPANIYAAANKVNYQKGTFNGKGSGYLWLRIPLQVFYIVWVYLFAIHK